MPFFCWEKTIGDRWMPVIHAENPNMLRIEAGASKESAPDRTPLQQIDDDVSLHEAAARFPSPSVQP